VRVAEEVAEAKHGNFELRANNGAVAKVAPRLVANARHGGGGGGGGSSSMPERSKRLMFDSLWPKGQRPMQEAEAVAPNIVSAHPAAAPEPGHRGETAAAPHGPVSVLKSGVVDGMGYTLYSDGSIEAQLPRGTLRFNSIADLRNHVENEA
jgi:hypothetical protein